VSGGQRQRIAIARALAAGAEMLILDEPTSALDATAEEAIAETIERLRGTVTLIVIAHRPRTVERCDRLVELRDGVASLVR
jgi:ABC-type bacteriocin/lantibiotic exporter with double-glycine peptidase domain